MMVGSPTCCEMPYNDGHSKPTNSAMPFLTRSLLVSISITSVLLCMSDGAKPPKQNKVGSANGSRAEKNPVQFFKRPGADIKQTFPYYPRPAIPDELQGYAGTQEGGAGTYRMVVDEQGAEIGRAHV